jgi:hypothetical protein
MKNIQFQCDRCTKIINGSIDDIPAAGVPNRMTTGFYDVTNGHWEQFARWEEEKICDDCMHQDEKYIKFHGTGF